MPEGYTNILIADAEQRYASKRAKSLWGDAAWVMRQSGLNSKLFIVSSGPFFESRHYGEGESWDEAFIAAGASLFPNLDREILSVQYESPNNQDVLTIQADGQPVIYTEEQRDRDKGRM